MSYLDEFKQKHGPPTDCVKVPEASLKAYNGRLPDGLLAEWEENGWHFAQRESICPEGTLKNKAKLVTS
jgi:hypothetical protein